MLKPCPPPPPPSSRSLGSCAAWTQAHALFSRHLCPCLAVCPHVAAASQCPSSAQHRYALVPVCRWWAGGCALPVSLALWPRATVQGLSFEHPLGPRDVAAVAAWDGVPEGNTFPTLQRPRGSSRALCLSQSAGRTRGSCCAQGRRVTGCIPSTRGLLVYAIATRRPVSPLSPALSGGPCSGLCSSAVECEHM